MPGPQQALGYADKTLYYCTLHDLLIFLTYIKQASDAQISSIYKLPKEKETVP